MQGLPAGFSLQDGEHQSFGNEGESHPVRDNTLGEVQELREAPVSILDRENFVWQPLCPPFQLPGCVWWQFLGWRNKGTFSLLPVGENREVQLLGKLLLALPGVSGRWICAGNSFGDCPCRMRGFPRSVLLDSLTPHLAGVGIHVDFPGCTKSWRS